VLHIKVKETTEQTVDGEVLHILEILQTTSSKPDCHECFITYIQK
jgi:hypothetical protein